MKRIQVSASFFCLLAGLIFLDTEGLFLYFFLAAAVHELGHLLAIWLGGGKLLSFRLSGAGGVIRYRLPQATVLRQAAIALGGCTMGIVLACGAAWAGQPLLSGASTLLTLFNLLPFRFLDGGRTLYLLFGKRIFLEVLGYGCLVVLFCFGGFMAIYWHGFGLLLIAFVLLFRQLSDLQPHPKQGMI